MLLCVKVRLKKENIKVEVTLRDCTHYFGPKEAGVERGHRVCICESGGWKGSVGWNLGNCKKLCVCVFVFTLLPGCCPW